MRLLSLILLAVMMPALADISSKSTLEIDPQTVEEAQFYNVLIRITRCSTVVGETCYFTIPTETDLLYYLKYCLRLNKWILTFSFPSRSALNITLTKYPKTKDTCLITITDTIAQLKQECLLNKKELKAIVKSPELPAFFTNFNNNPNYGLQFTDPLLQSFNTCLTSNPY